MVTRVPISSVAWSPLLKQVMSSKDASQKKKKQLEIPRKTLILSFIQDKQKYGEYFV